MGITRFVSAALLLAVLTGHTLAFDTGPHFDLTHSALSEHSFGGDAIQIVQVENWLTDYYSSSPTISKSKRAELEKLHFDNLFNTRQVTNYWGRLIENLRSGTKKAAADDDRLRMLIIAGIGLHAVQDFYTHSNWVETHPRQPDGSYRTDTFLSSGPPPNVALYTGKYPETRKTGPGPDPIPAGALPHGGYSSGVNHDSAIRPRWDEAYVFAYCASHELIGLMEKWANEKRPGFWKSVGEYEPAAAEKAKLDYDARALRNMSMWIKGQGQDGHWKGDKSGSARFFSAFSAKWVGKNSSVFVKAGAMGTIQEELAKDLYSNLAPPVLPTTAAFALKRRAVLLRVIRVAELKDAGRITKTLASTGGADFYTRVIFGDQEYWGRTMQKSRESDDPWFEIHFVDQSARTIPIGIALWDEDDTDSDKDQQLDINSAPGKKTLSFTYRLSDGSLAGDITGIFNTPGTAFLSEGAKPDTDRAQIKFYLTALDLK
jgi:hypothetical protein